MNIKPAYCQFREYNYSHIEILSQQKGMSSSESKLLLCKMKYKAKKSTEETPWDEYLCELQSKNKIRPVIFPMAQASKQAMPCRFTIISLCPHYLDTQSAAESVPFSLLQGQQEETAGWLRRLLPIITSPALHFFPAAKTAGEKRGLSRGEA